MRSTILISVGLGFACVCTSSGAIIPANPRVVAGFDGISVQGIGEVFTAFCRRNGCTARFLDAKTGSIGWSLIVGDTRPVSVGPGCWGVPHHDCVQTWGRDGRAFMTPVRLQQLKQMLEDKGAKVVLMDCSFKETEGIGQHYVCTNGKSPP